MTLARQLSLAMVSVALLTGALVAGFIGYGVSEAMEPIERVHMQGRLHAAIADLQSSVRGVRADAETALEAAPMRDLLAAHMRGQPLPAAQRDAALTVFRAMLDAKPQYLQLRLIAADQEGRELLRVDRAEAGAAVRVVPERALQAKGGRPYVIEARKLREHEVYVSPIELNQELGQIAVPHVPVLRAAVASHGADGAANGLVVLNVDMGPALARMQTSLKTWAHSAYLFDEHGSFLMHPDRSRVFGHDLGTGEGLQRSFPELTNLLGATDPWIGWLRDTKGKRSRFIALPFALIKSPDTRHAGPKLVLLAGGLSTTATAVRGARRAVLSAALLAVALASLAAVLLSRKVTRPLGMMTRLAEHYPNTEGEALPIQAAGELGALARALARMDNQIRDRNQQLERQELRFRRMFEAAPHAALMIDQAQRIILANARAEVLFGYRHDELIGSELDRLIPAGVRARHHTYAAEFIDKPSTRAMGLGRTFEITRKDGAVAHVEIGLAPVDSGEGRAVLASIVDVSGRVRSENALRQSNRELEQFAYVASHDLQEPLRMVANYTELLGRRYQGKLDEKADKYIRYAVDGARRMQRMISDLLTFSRVQSQGGSFVPVDLNVTLHNVIEALHVKIAETQAEVRAASLPVVSADVSQMQQLFQNLLDNAIKFRAEQPPRVTVSAAADPGNPGRTRISVCDNGIGIDMQNAERLFQMFQRGFGRERYAGTGIGLAISKRVVERHGGTIWVEPTPGGGTTFCFTLPLTSSAPGRQA